SYRDCPICGSMVLKNPPPMDETVRAAAVEAILAKGKALIEERQAIRDEMAELDRRLRRNEVNLFDCRAAARLFDADIPLPEDLPTARAVWVRRVMSEPPGPTGPPGPTPPPPPLPSPPHGIATGPVAYPTALFGGSGPAQVRTGAGTLGSLFA